MNYTLTTIDGKMHLQAVNPYEKPDQDVYMPSDNFTRKQQDAYWSAFRKWEEFNATRSPILWIGPELPEGTVLKDEEVEVRWEVYDPYDLIWIALTAVDTPEGLKKLGASTRKVATLKEPTKEERICVYKKLK